MSVIDGFKGLIVPTGISLNTSSSTIKIGYPLQLIATITPSGAINKNVKWTSSNTNIATVENGLVTPVAVGNCTITATTEYGDYTDTCSCTITVVHTTGVSLNESSIKIAKGKTFQLEATVTPSDTSYPQVTWSSSNTSVATVSQDGLVTCVGSVDGNCTITCTTVDGGYTATCEVIQGRAPGNNTIVYLPLEGDLSRYGRYSTGAVNIGSDTPYEDIFGNIQGIRFKGNDNSYVQITDVPAMDTDFTLNFWALLYSNTGGMFVERGTSNNTNCRLHYVIRNTTKVDLGFYANDCPGTTNTVNGVWYNFTATYNHTTREQKVYINGALDGSRIGSGDPAFGSGALNLGGAHSFTTGDNANCTMSRFIWEDRIWSETDINDYIDLTISDYQDKIENYQEVEYIQSSGSQVIKTGVYITEAGYRANIDFQITNSSASDQAIIGFYNNESGSNSYRCGYGPNDGFTMSAGASSLDRQTATGNTISFTASSYQIYLFAKQRYTNGNRDSNATGRIYSCQIYGPGDILVRDFMPCYRKSDNVIGLFDKVNNIFYTNQGSGTFTKGEDLGVKLNKKAILLDVAGKTEQLIATTLPADIAQGGFTWTSSNTNIATVNSNGLVTCVTPGECIITCTTNIGGYTAQCQVVSEVQPVSVSFSYTGGDQNYTVPYPQEYKLEAWGAGSNNSSGGYVTGTMLLSAGDELSIMVGGKGDRSNDGSTYGFGGSTTYGGRGGGGLSGIFTGSGAIGVNDSSRVLIIAGGAGGGLTGGGAGGGETGQNGNGGRYGWAGGGGTQTGKGSGNNRDGQFYGGGGSGTYGFGGGGGWRGGGGSGGDGSADDDAQAGGGSGYVLSSMSDRVLTQGGGLGAGCDGCVKITSI